MKYIIIFIIITQAILAEYKLIKGKRARSAIDRLHFKSVADMRSIPQNLYYYAKEVKPLTKKEMLRYDKEYNKEYFKPWSINYIDEPEDELFWQIKFVKKRVIYNSKKRVISSKIKKYWIKNSNFKALNSLNLRAITIKHSNIRAFPTTTSAYLNPKKPTAWFPFDFFQHSAIYPNTPLFISHYSKDKRWAFVQAPYVNGWIKRGDIALVDENFIKNFKTGKYAITIKDDLWLVKDKRVISLVKLGTIFPIKNNYLLTAIKVKNIASIAKLKAIPKNLVAKKPIPMTPKNVALIAKELYNEPYGWGGKMQTRDCSATTRDFFAPFGIFLPRNSSKQAKRGKEHIYIKGLPKNIKKETIINRAKPFRSLLFVPGHIGIYLGKYKKEPVIMHTYWGVRLKNWSKYPLCRTIITTTEPGRELPNIREKSKLINTLKYIINF